MKHPLASQSLVHGLYSRPRLRTGLILTLMLTLSACHSLPLPFMGKRAKPLPMVQDTHSDAENASTLVREAETAVNNGSPATAVRFAELAVGAQPQNMTARRMLARAYVAAGRFRSAAQAYDDLAAAGDRDSATWAALATLAAGQQQEALARLSMLEGRANEGDLGLAFALAGETARGIEILTRAANNGGTARVRQNLALALALDGQWAAARVTAQQDLTPEQIQKRTDEWMRIQELNSAAARAAAILGVSPAQEDTGRPDALAWVAPQPQPMAQAMPWMGAQGVYAQPPYGQAYGQPYAAPNAPPVYAQNSYPQGAYGQMMPGAPNGYGASYANAPAPTTAYPPQNAYGQGYAMPAPQPNYAANAYYGAPSAPVAAPAAPAVSEDASAANSGNAGFSDNFRASRSAGGWMVQLGAYSDQQQLAQQWEKMQARNKSLKGREAVVSEARLANGQKIYRLQINGFTDRNAADRLCDLLKTQGRACFVRPAV